MVKRRGKADEGLAVGYVRASKDSQQLTPEAQRDAISKWCAAHGLTLAAVYEETASSVAPLDKRLALIQAMQDVKQRRAGVLLVARRDRLGRDPLLVGYVEKELALDGAAVQSAGGEPNGKSPGDGLMRRIIDAFAEYERLMIKARTKAALAVKARRGERVGRVPYGWKVADDGKTLEPEPREAEVVALVVKLRGEGKAYREIVEALQGRGIVSRAGKPLAIVQVRNICQRHEAQKGGAAEE